MAVLLERDAELASLDGLVEDVVAGQGRTVVLRGEAGIGKTSLLERLVATAADRVRILRAAGMPLATGVAYGVLRDLLAPLAEAPSAGEDPCTGDALLAARALGWRPAPAGFGADAGSIAYGVHRLAMDAADERPLLLIVDDLHWADEASVAALGYLARRSEGSSLALVFATRPLPDGPIADVVDDLLGSGAETIGPSPLSAAATGVLVDDVLDGSAGATLGEACHTACGGNPFLVQELARAVLEAGTTDLDAEGVLALGAATAGGPILRRLGRLRGVEHDIAVAVAVLGADSPQHVAQLTAAAPAVVADVADDLVARHVFASGRPLRFAHPLLAAAVEGQLPEGRRSVLHHRAARLLTDARADPQVVAVHLLRCDPGGEDWVIEQLLTAADRLGAIGEWPTAGTILERAVAEGAEGTEVQWLLGLAETFENKVSGLDHLRTAIDAWPGDRPGRHNSITILAMLEVTHGQCERAVARLRAFAQDEQTAAQLLVATSIANFGTYAGAVHQLVAPERARLLEATADEIERSPDVAATVSMLRLMEGRTPADDIVPVAVRSLVSLADAGMLRSQSSVIASGVLSLAGHAEAGTWLDRVAAALWERGFGNGRVPLHRLGHGTSLHPLVVDCERSLHLFRHTMPSSFIVGPLLEALVAMGRLDEADDHLRADASRFSATSDAAEASVLLGAAALRQAQGRLAEAESMLERVGDRCGRIGAVNPAVQPWRGRLAVLRARRGDPTATDLATEELRLAQAFGAPLPIGVALTALATIDPDHRTAGATLHEALTHLDDAPLDRARALTALGVRTLRAGDRDQAREHLTVALDQAAAIGATTLVDQARSELVALGARPRRLRRSGIDALTSAERRVAELAATGRINREIADELYLSPKTVENHLSRCYTKLEVTGRTELQAALAT